MNDQPITELPQDAGDAALRAENIMDEFLSAASVQAVYGKPVEHGENLIIPAAEILSGAGFGIGSGSGRGTDAENTSSGSGNGSGGGGGGRVLSRPVAVIVASPAGVSVQPVIDVTKIGLAALTAIGFIFAASRRMRRGNFEE